MLKFYRKNIKTIIWLIVLSFVAWGVGTISISREEASPYIGSVGGEKISHKEFLTTLRFYELLTRVQEKEIEPKEKKSTSEPPSFEALRSQAWQAIVLSREAARQGIRASDEEVRAEVQRLFSSEAGGFDREFYQRWITANFRGEARDFEETVRKHLHTGKLQEKVLTGVPESEREGRWLAWLISTYSKAKVQDDTTVKEEAPATAAGP